MQPKYCFLDVETTGRNPEKNGVVQVGGIICGLENRSLTELESFNFHIAPFPSDLIEDEALAISGITREQIQKYDLPKVAHEQLIAVFGKYCDKFNKQDKMLFLGYNVQFDYGFLRSWFTKAGDKYFGSWFWHPPIDVMTLAALHLAPVRHELPDFKLTTVAARLGVKLSSAHDALSDAMASKEIFSLCSP